MNKFTRALKSLLFDVYKKKIDIQSAKKSIQLFLSTQKCKIDVKMLYWASHTPECLELLLEFKDTPIEDTFENRKCLYCSVPNPNMFCKSHKNITQQEWESIAKKMIAFYTKQKNISFEEKLQRIEIIFKFFCQTAKFVKLQYNLENIIKKKVCEFDHEDAPESFKKIIQRCKNVFK